MTARQRLLAALSEQADAALAEANRQEGLTAVSDAGKWGRRAEALAWAQAFKLADELTRPEAGPPLQTNERDQLLRERAEALDLAGSRALRIVELEAQLGAALRALRAGVEGLLDISRLALLANGGPVGEWKL